jgi:hypothetical protein
MTADQKRNMLLVVIICLVVFAILALPNLRGAQSEKMLSATSTDEPVTYAYVVRMLTPARDLRDLFSRWVLYGDYHYGYPFYFLSALVVLPVKIIYGGLFESHTALNIFLLRQLISVLPMLLAIALMVFMQTRFKSWWWTLGLLVFLLTTRAFVRNDIQWWHPDALSVLAVVLTLFFLERDNLRFGRNFYLAAVACGLAVGIKLAGIFFILAIPAYLAAGVWQRKLTWARGLGMAAIFVLIMGASVVVSNPFLYNSGARKELAGIQAFKEVELTQGYSQGDPSQYEKTPQAWAWTLSTWYGTPAVLAFLGLSLLAGCIWGPNRLLNRLILAWIIPYSLYLLFFVAVKPDHYWLPVMLPLFSTALNIPVALDEKLIPWLRARTYLSAGVLFVIIGLLAGQVFGNINRPYSGIIAQYSSAMAVEQAVK